MKFNLYLKNGIPIKDETKNSPQFKRLWKEQEIAVLSHFFAEKCKIKKAD